MSTLFRFAVTVVCFSSLAAAQQPLHFLHRGDRLLFQGDSITDGGRQRTGSDYNHIMGQDYAYVLAAEIGSRYPEENFTFVNRGISGDRVMDLAARWQTVRGLRRAITGALEIERAAKRIGSSLEARAVIHAGAAERAALDGIDMAELCITSDARFADGPAPADAFALPDIPGVRVVVEKAPGAKCVRCWRVLPEVGHVHAHPTLCERCADGVDHGAAAAQ